MTRFRPCIDLHNGVVKQIVGASLRDGNDDRLVTNGVSDQPASWFAARYRADGLFGGHVIMLGPGNDQAAREALAAFPGGLHLGGGVTPENARRWLDAGAAAVIVTSYAFRDGDLDRDRLAHMSRVVGRERLVLDLSCRQREARPDAPYYVMTDRWQRWTEFAVSEAALHELARWCGEFLVHAIANEGTGQGIEQELVKQLGAWSPLPVTYAGGAHSLHDLTLVEALSQGRVDLTIGSALDLFGGKTVRYADAVAFNHSRAATR